METVGPQNTQYPARGDEDLDERAEQDTYYYVESYKLEAFPKAC